MDGYQTPKRNITVKTRRPIITYEHSHIDILSFNELILSFQI